jgi:multicomponent K+:H+ antiporter subunit A
MPRTPHEPPRFMRVPVELLVILCVVVGVAPAAVVGPLLETASRAVVGGPLPPIELHVWHGFNVPLLMSAMALVLGAVMYALRQRIRSLQDRYLPQVEARDAYHAVVNGATLAARGLTRALETGSLQRYLALVVGAAVVVAAVPALRLGLGRGPQPLVPVDGATAAAWVILVVAAASVVVFHRRRLTALIMISVVGLLVSLAFVRLSAPDLALTQLLVEVVTVVLVLLALHFLPQNPPAESSAARRLRDGALAGMAGLGTAALAWAVLTRPRGGIAHYYVEQSKPLGGGTNIVNVILVDFRGFDTLGEITVLGVAALGIYVMLEKLLHQDVAHDAPFARDRYPVILAQMTRVLLPYAIGVALYLFLRGHNMPGGGFIAGLLTAVAVVLQFLASGIRWTEDRLATDFRTVIALGILIALATGLGGWFFDSPFLDHSFTHVHLPLIGDVELATAAIFDLGVLVAVVGVVILILERLGRLLEGGPLDPVHRKESDPWKP